MSKRITFKPAAPLAVPRGKLQSAQYLNGRTCIGEKFAMVIISKTQAELRDLLEQWNAEVTNGDDFSSDMVECLGNAEESLKIRLELVTMAFARLFVVNDELKAKGINVQI